MKPALCLLALVAISSFAQEPPRRLSLAEAIRFAESNSPVLGAAKSELDAANASAKVARADTLPQVAANGFAADGNKSALLGNPPGLMQVPSGSFVGGSLGLMIPLLVPRESAMAGAADRQTRAVAGELAEVRDDLDLHVTEAYDRVLLYRQIALAEEAKIKAAEELVRTTQALLDAGKGIEATVQRARAELSIAQRALTTARNEADKSALDLAATMGANLAESLDPSDTLALSPVPSDLSEYVRRARRARGLLVAAEARLEAAELDIRAAQGSRLPRLYGVVMGDATNRREMGDVTAGLTLSFPIFDGGRIDGEVAQARSKKAKAEDDLRQARLIVERDIRQAWLDVQTAQANEVSAEAAVKAALESYDVVALRVSAGKSILIEQLDALETLTRAKADLAQATFDQAIAVAKLNRAAGGER
ncbi:MAG TPA: TolC family protein [Fimbriimonadaceae bacterium]|nr:TolC family protein [Fimbriimonadaceae bacterium]